MKNTHFYLILISLFTSLSCAQSENPPFIELGDKSKIYLEKVIDGIDIPWGISFINENEMLVTDKKGILYHVKDNTKTSVQGIPKVVENRQGGLLDVEVDKDFKNNRRIFLTTSNSSSNSKESNTALYSANYNDFNISKATISRHLKNKISNHEYKEIIKKNKKNNHKFETENSSRSKTDKNDNEITREHLSNKEISFLVFYYL